VIQTPTIEEIKTSLDSESDDEAEVATTPSPKPFRKTSETPESVINKLRDTLYLPSAEGAKSSIIDLFKALANMQSVSDSLLFSWSTKRGLELYYDVVSYLVNVRKLVVKEEVSQEYARSGIRMIQLLLKDLSEERIELSKLIKGLEETELYLQPS
jgi:hypothetical protein